MKISKYYGADSIRVSGNGGSVPLRQSSPVSAADEKDAAILKSAVENNIKQKIYDAVDDFLYLSKEDRLDGYMNLSGEDREKFLKIVSNLLEDGKLKKENLEVEEVPEDESKAVELSLNEKRLNGPKVYNHRGKSIDL